MVWAKFIICLLFGYFGVHKFMEKKIGMGMQKYILKMPQTKC